MAKQATIEAPKDLFDQGKALYEAGRVDESLTAFGQVIASGMYPRISGPSNHPWLVVWVLCPSGGIAAIS